MDKFPYTGLGQSLDMEIRLLSNRLSELGEQLPIAVWVGKGDFFEAAKESVKTANPSGSHTKQVSTVLVNGDPFEMAQEYANGEVKIGNNTYNIVKFRRRRNPDGSVHHTIFEVE